MCLFKTLIGRRLSLPVYNIITIIKVLVASPFLQTISTFVPRYYLGPGSSKKVFLV